MVGYFRFTLNSTILIHHILVHCVERHQYESETMLLIITEFENVGFMKFSHHITQTKPDQTE